MGNFKEDIAAVRAFVFDVDGVFTDGGIIVTPEGDFIRKYNSKDGYAVAYAIKMGYPVAIITGGRGNTLEVRFKMLGVSRLYANCGDKINKLREFMEDFGLHPHEVLFMGDDIPDREAMMYAGVPVCPADAVSEVVEISRYVSSYRGGEGCVRDVVEQVLRARGDWAKDSQGVNTVHSA
jgi:3-deoxy-D-manno-octulosonate 8-phosphate phosphatase (KDO 8-P phosphatase)